MNKHGGVFHWILFFGVVAGFGLFFLFIGTDPGVGVRGIWHTNFLWGVQEAEKDLLLLDSAVRPLVEETKVWMNGPEFVAADFGCDFFYVVTLEGERAIPFLNTDGRYCSPQLHEQFVAKFSELLQDKTPISYELELDRSDLLGKSSVHKVLSSAPVQESTEAAFPADYFVASPAVVAYRGGGVPATVGEVQQAVPATSFYFYYEYNPSFRVPLGTDFSEFFAARQEAPAFVESCRAEVNLTPCVYANLPSDRWQPYSDCFNFVPSLGRKVAFCYQGDGIRTSVALEFG